MGTETGIEMGKIRIIDKNGLVEKGKEIYKKIKMFSYLEIDFEGKRVRIE